MESDRDTLLLTGELKPGLSRESAAPTLSTLLGVPRDLALQWLAGGEQVLRTNLECGTSFRLWRALREAGIGARLHRMTPAEVADAEGHPDLAARYRNDKDAAPWIAKELAVMSPQHAPAIAALSVPPGPVSGMQDEWMRSGNMPCPCCGFKTLPQRGAGDECMICGWRDDRGQNEHYPDKVVKGRNFGLSLNAARKECENYGSLDRSAYTPNEVELRKRVINGLIALGIIVYCGFSLWIGIMIVPGDARYGGGALVLEEDVEIWLMSAAGLSAAIYGVLSIVDHYDRRRNEHVYQKAVKASFVLMAAFMGLSIAAKLYREDGFSGGVVGGIITLLLTGVTLARMMQKDRIEY